MVDIKRKYDFLDEVGCYKGNEGIEISYEREDGEWIEEELKKLEIEYRKEYSEDVMGSEIVIYCIEELKWEDL